MKILGSITSGYKKIATGITIVAFLALMYIALIPGGTFAASGVFNTQGVGIGSAFVKIVEWTQYNATTAPDGTYTINNVPYGTYNISAHKVGYTKNVSKITLSSSSLTKDFTLFDGGITGDYRYFSMVDGEVTANKISTISDFGKSFTIPQYGDNIGWNTDVYVTDVSGLGANLVVTYYWPNGTVATTENPTVPVNGTYKWRPSDGTNGRPTSGKLGITSDNNITGEFSISSRSNTDVISSKLYNLADASTSLSIPQYGDHVGWDTYLAIADVSGLGASLNISFYYPNGTFAVKEPVTIPPNGFYQDVPMSDGRNGRPMTGSVVITSNNNIIGEYRLYSLGNGGLISNKLYTPADKRTSFIVPQYGDHVAWDSFLAISDASGIGADLTLKFYHPNGTLAVIEQQTVPPNGMYTDLPLTDGRNGRPKVGKLEIASNNKIYGEMRIYSLSGRGIMSESLFIQTDNSNMLVVPYYGNNLDFGTYVVLADVSGLSTTVKVDYHNLNGALARTENMPIPADGLYGLVVSDGSNGKPNEGNMFISVIQ